MGKKGFLSNVQGYWDRTKTLTKRHARLVEGVVEGVIAAVLLSLSLYVLLYFISGPAVAFFHSDCADSLLWAQATVESGELLTEQFHYAALLPFGSPLWMVPVLKIFGYTMTAQNVSMAIFAVLFVFAAYFMFRAMKWNTAASAGSTFLLVMLLSGSVKLREIMWQHVIYYSLGLLFLMLLLNLYLRLADCIRHMAQNKRTRKDYIRFSLLAVALFALCIGCGLDGMQILVLCVVPVIGSSFVVAFLNGNAKFRSHEVLGKYLLCGLLGVGALIGLMLIPKLTHGGKIEAAYENGFSVWTPMNTWWEHIEGFLTEYLNLFGVDITSEIPLFTVSSVFTLLQLVAALIVLVCPILLLLRYRKLNRTNAQIVAWAHCILSCILMLGYICGALAMANWRLVPMVGSCIIATLVYLRELWDDKAFQRRFAIVLLAILAVTALHHSKTILDLPNNAGDNQKYIAITQELAEKGYTKGYATFWHASTATLLSDGEVDISTVLADEYGVRPRYYQTMDHWFESQEGRENYFLMLTEEEFGLVSASEYWLQLMDTNPWIDIIQTEGFLILVFEYNPVA